MPAASSPVGFGLKTLTLSLLFSLGMTAHAGTPTTITADPSADKSLQPIVLPTASGIVSVNIATPNDKGLSNNHYSQFDVSSTGAVLNNNRKAVNTQIAGYVQANPFMAKGEASTILNQINSNNPSHLGGFIEIAGQKADVIIANPSGLVVNGAGFINAGNVHLVAANGKFDQGQITGYQVNTGNIEVNGKLNLQNTDYAALIAKTAQINDEIYAGSVLDIVTGENTVTLQDGKFNQLSAAHKNDGASSTNQTGIALDVAALGGMYAGKIRLIGTDKGFGVNNQGMIAATGSGVQAGTGTLTLDHQGNLVNTGIVSAKDKLAVNTHNHSVQNDGTLLGEQSDIAIDTAKLTNTGTIASTQNTKITATNAIDNQGSMYGGVLQVSTDELTNTGKLVQTGTGKLTISTHTLTNTNKAAIGQSLYEKTQLKAPSVPSTDQSAGTVSHQPADNTTTNNSNNGANTPNPSTDTPSANGFISTTKSLNNTGDKALITATGDIGITANQTRNTHQASIDAQSFTTNTLANTDSKIALDDIHWQLTSFDNSKGDISAKDGMVIESGSTIINAEGSLTSGGDMVLVAKNEFNNSDGVTQSAGGASITASSIINNQGMIHSAHALTLSADGTLTNNDGVISGTQNTTVATKTAIDNADGRIQSHGKLSINTRQLNSTGTIYAAQDTAITASHINNEQAGLIASAKDVRIDTQSLTSAGTISAGMQSDGKLGNTPANISIQATEGIRNNGNAIATGTLTLNANTINLDDSKTQADNITLLAQDTISTRKTSTVASNSLAITAPNKLDNSEGILSANEMIVNTDVLDNRQGTISQAGKTALSLAIKRSIDNTLGTISTNSDKLKIDTNQLINQQGAIHHAGVGELHVKSENLNNNQGELLSLGTQTLNINKTIDNSQGVISATGFTINADGLDNTAGLLQATDKEADNSLNIDSTLDNNKLAREQGSIDVAGNLVLTAKALQNQGAITANNLKATVANVNNTGAIGVRGNIQIASSQDIDNTGNISAAGNITLNANNIISHQGVMMAADNITATANRLNFNQSTSSADNISLSAQADIHHNQGATVANNKLSLKNTSAIYNQGGVLSANHTSIDTKDLQNGGIIQADVLAIKQQADYTHTDNDKLLANNLQFSTDGKIINQSQLIANQDLTLGANHIDNTQTGTISSGNHTQITSQTSINNQGLINGETTVIKAKETINNQSGGRIYGTHLAIQADTLNNTPAKAEQSDGKYTAPVIAARQRLDIGVKTLNNNPNPDRAGKFNENFDSQALITSLGSLHIGGSLDDNHHATGKAQTVVNKGATIESGGGMVIDTKTLLNGNADFKKHKVEVIEESVRKQTLYRAHEQASTIPAAQKSTDTADLDKKPMAGLFDCPPDSDCIINYDNDSVIWTHFGIEPPKEPIPDIKAKDLLDEPELPEGEDAQSCTLAGADNQACTQYKEALAHYTKVMGPLLKWEEENSTAIEALQLAIREHNRQFAKSDSDLALNIYTTDEAYLGPTSKKGAPEGALYVRDINGIGRFATEEVDVITTDFVVYEDKTLASDPARMVAGANLVVYGDTLINDKSQMSAGAGFLVVGDTVVQTPDNGLYGEKVKQTENGYFTRYTVESSAGGRRHKRVPTNSGAFVQEFAPLDAYQLPILNATINTIPVSTKHPPDALSSNDNQALLDALQANQANLSATAQAKLTALLSVKQSGQDVDEAVLASLVNELEHSIANNQAVVVTKTDNTINLPNSSLYTINADNPNLPVVQTDPAFTNYKQWLGSDYMLKAIQSDPNHIHKRLSDGYGEQARIKDEYYLLTGRHINTDYHSNEEAFKQLMDNGITAAKQFGYTLGTALTPDQMANLTSDIVWLVKQSITYTTKDKDGNSITKTEDVLVPKLYLRSANIATGTLSPDGRYSAVSARNINMQLTGDLDNNGNLIAKDTAAITANNVNNTGVINGDFVKISTNNDLINHGTLHANSAMGLDAKNRIMSQSLTTTQTNTQGRSSSSRTDLSQIATISVGEGLKDKTDDNGKPLTTLSLRGNQIIYQGATSDNAGGNTQMTAKNGIDITTITTSNHISAVADDNNYFKYSQTTDVGSNITSYGDTIIRTTGKNADINIKGSHLNATGTTALIATGDISITEGRATQSLDTASKFTDKGILSKKTTQTTHQMDSNTSIQSTVGGENILIKSGGNTQLTGVEAKATETIRIETGGHLIMDAAKDTLSTKTSSSENSKWIGATVDKGDYTRTYEQVDAITTTLQAKNIGTKSNGSTLLEGTQFDYTQSASVVSGEKLYLQAAISGTSEHTTSNDNYVVWQKTKDSGSIKQTATLPSFVGSSEPTIIALDGVDIQIPISQKDQEAGTTLQEQIDTLIQQPEYSYLNQFIDREDATWQEIILAEDSWDYEQEGLTPAAAALISIAVGIATNGVGASLLGTTGATTTSMANAAFSSLASQASVTLINNKGNVAQTLKDLGKSDTVKSMAQAAVTAGVTASLDKIIANTTNIDISASAGFDDKLARGVIQGTGHALTESLMYGTSLEESLKRHLTNQLVDAAAAGIYTHGVKPLDINDTELISNVAHKLAAGLTGCVAAKAKDQSCESAAIGAIIGEMVGDWMANKHEVTLPDGEKVLILSDEDKQKILNTAKLTAGSIALLYDFNVDTATQSADEAVRNNTLYQEHLNTYLELIYENRRTKKFDEYTFIKEVIMPAMAKNSEQTYQEFNACVSSSQASSCLPHIQNRLKQTNYEAILREVGIIPEAYNQVLAYAQRNHDLAYCNESSGNGCLNLAQFKRNIESGVFIPATSARVGVKTPTPKPAKASKPSQNIGRNNTNYSDDFHASISNRQPDYFINLQATKRVHQVTAPIDFDGHILNAEIKSGGKVVGGHSTANGNIKILSVTKQPDKKGVYEAKIAVKDPTTGSYLPKSNNSGKSTMFPETWTADRVKVEVDYAYQHKITHPDPNKAKNGMWYGKTPSGVAVEGFLTPKTTVYPLYNK
ncbi:p120 [Moraxella caprae]|uniref:p120 n=2 Tax=Moraxella caprae TaxID=90240 RepID=A0A378QXN6_9GAMM|nr:EndoU domain-containing protein [Moraxella caprae]STZ07685.1 p120 [Moraxella caprae]